MENAYNQDVDEIKKFSDISDQWWDEKGTFKALHWITIPRVQFIIDHLKESFSKKLKNIQCLDVGCGGGLLCEPLSRLGYTIKGIDASAKAISVAAQHATDMELSIEYINQDLSDFKVNGSKVDVLFLLELLEHVPNPRSLVHDALECLKPGGLLFFSTLNRTWKSYVLGIKVAENILKWAPKGAHSYEKFLKPSELQGYFEEKNFSIIDIKGLTFNILKGDWSLSDDLTINYIGVAKKTG